MIYRNKVPDRGLIWLLILLSLAAWVSTTRRAFSQPVDWHRSHPAPGLEWLQFGGSLFNSNQWINVLLIDTSRFDIKLARDDKKLKPLSQWADSTHAMAAINGNFFHTAEGGSVCFVRVDGLTTDTTRSDLPPRRFLPELDDGALVADANGWSIRPVPASGWAPTPFRTVVSAGPPLIFQGRSLKLPDYGFSKQRYGRSAVGFRPDGVMVWLTVSGREPASTGFSLLELQQMMLQLGCTDALNLDGGSSAAMWLRDALPSPLVSIPPGIKSTERPVANALVVIPKK